LGSSYLKRGCDNNKLRSVVEDSSARQLLELSNSHSIYFLLCDYRCYNWCLLQCRCLSRKRSRLQRYFKCSNYRSGCCSL